MFWQAWCPQRRSDKIAPPTAGGREAVPVFHPAGETSELGRGVEVPCAVYTIGMISSVFRTAVGLLVAGAGLFGSSSIYDFSLNSIDGAAAPLAAYRGKVLLVVNVASYCGYTPQYQGLEALYEKYKDRGLVVIGFPANNFGAQEPGTNAEIKDFCERTYHVKFPMYAKISVDGADKAPLYQYLTAAKGGNIQWNFTKFLISRDGRILGRFEPDVTPESSPVTAAIEKALGQ